jgi:hypothetical protein
MRLKTINMVSIINDNTYLLLINIVLQDFAEEKK